MSIVDLRSVLALRSGIRVFILTVLVVVVDVDGDLAQEISYHLPAALLLFELMFEVREGVEPTVAEIGHLILQILELSLDVA